MIRWFCLCEEGNVEGHRIEAGLPRFISEYVVPRIQRGLYDAALDRTLATMTGFLIGMLLRNRSPYEAPIQSDVEECREGCARNLPEFIQEIWRLAPRREWCFEELYFSSNTSCSLLTTRSRSSTRLKKYTVVSFGNSADTFLDFAFNTAGRVSHSRFCHSPVSVV